MHAVCGYKLMSKGTPNKHSRLPKNIKTVQTFLFAGFVQWFCQYWCRTFHFHSELPDTQLCQFLLDQWKDGSWCNRHFCPACCCCDTEYVMLVKSRLWFVIAGLSPEDIIPLGDKDSVPENLEGVYLCPVNLCLPNGFGILFLLPSFVSVFSFSLSVCIYVSVCVCVLCYVAVTDLGGGGVTFFHLLASLGSSTSEVTLISWCFSTTCTVWIPFCIVLKDVHVWMLISDVCVFQKNWKNYKHKLKFIKVSCSVLFPHPSLISFCLNFLLLLLPSWYWELQNLLFPSWYR